MMLAFTFPILIIVTAFIGVVATLDENLLVNLNKSLMPSIDVGIKHETRFRDQNRNLIFHLFCVRTEEQLRNAVRSAVSVGPTHTRINLCTRNMKISGIVDAIWNRTGINVSNKWIDLRCRKLWGRCNLDGQGLNSLLFGIDANVKTHRINFVNSRARTYYDYENYELSHAAIVLVNSIATISQSIFRNNFGLMSCIFINGTVARSSSSLTLQDVTLENNNGVSLRLENDTLDFL
jgi:hypothetical protein